jgi:hypothetical protein
VERLLDARRLRRLVLLTVIYSIGRVGSALAIDGTPGCGPDNIFSDPQAMGGNMCSQFYALCIGAPCEGLTQADSTGYEGDGFMVGSGLATEADIVGHTLCKCPFINGNSIGKADCAARKPEGTKSISTYSFQFNNRSNEFLSCDQNNFQKKLSFADCYNQPCETDPADPTQVICKCPVFAADIIPNKTYLTRGGDCKQSACANKIWSGVPEELVAFPDAAMACGIGLPEPPPAFFCNDTKFLPVR